MEKPVRRIGRMIARERLKGIGGHRSRDLNRHIALKQLSDSLKKMRRQMAPQV